MLSGMNDALLLEIADTWGTPTYVYDLQLVNAQWQQLTDALPEARVYYAVKANPCGAVLRHLASHGVGAEVITEGELVRALAAGMPAERIILGGPGQSPSLMQRACDAGVGRVSLDSISQWQMWQQLDYAGEFLVRVNPALDPRTHDHLATGAAESKFGMTLAEAREVAAALDARGQLAGFHVHAGSQLTATEVYQEIFAVLEPLYTQFPAAGLLDIGGGFGVPGFDLDGFAEQVTTFAERFKVQVMLEPGRFLVAEAGVLLTRVRHVKRGAFRHVIADAGMADLLRPALYGANHPVRVIRGPGGEQQHADLDGPLCENADRLARHICLPALNPGDLLAIGQAGAYGFTMSSNYASSLRPAEVVVSASGYKLARRRETPDDLMRLECDV
jgi:diaminopimelate decarboxylase